MNKSEDKALIPQGAQNNTGEDVKPEQAHADTREESTVAKRSPDNASLPPAQDKADVDVNADRPAAPEA